jgi:hypothetical protein
MNVSRTSDGKLNSLARRLVPIEGFVAAFLVSSSYLRYGRCDLIDIITFIYFSMCYNYFDLSACHII